MKSPLLALLSLSILALSSCASKECYDNQNTLPLAAFLSAQTGKQITIANLSVYGMGAPNDSLLADNENINELYMPLRPDEPSSSFIFKYGGSEPTLSDTVSFFYSSKPWFVSEACGVVYYFNIDSISHSANLIDSVAVPGMLITNANKRFIEIYFKENNQL